MPIRVDCLTCRKWYKAPEKAAGKVVTCPGCGGELKVPADAPLIGEVPKASAAPRPAPAKPAPELPTLEDDDPFSIPGLTATASAPSGSEPGTPVPSNARKTPRKSSGGIAAAIMELIDWVVCHALVVAVLLMALILLVAGAATGGTTFAVGAAGAAAGGLIAGVGMILPVRPKPRKSPATEVPELMTPKVVGGILLALLILGWEIVSALLRHSARLEQSGQPVTPGAMAGATWRLAGGVAVLLVVCMGISGVAMAIGRFGVFRVLAPIYLVAGAILLVTGVPDGQWNLISNPMTPLKAEAVTE